MTGSLARMRSGIIPAYAGSTVILAVVAASDTDHPRIRGEHCRRQAIVVTPPGSSPHTRGARAAADRLRSALRIIPAYAGSTTRAPSSPNSGRDHPRIRGEHLNSGAAHRVAQGSSPHTRGARPVERHVAPANGIIPAYAGSTSTPTGPAPQEQDHPRIRGEHLAVSRLRGLPLGSSPHTRGAHQTKLSMANTGRIIPAYAGSTSYPCGPSPRFADHPRIRGEHRPVQPRPRG